MITMACMDDVKFIYFNMTLLNLKLICYFKILSKHHLLFRI